MKHETTHCGVACHVKPGQYERLNCWVCGNEMQVERNQIGATCLAEAQKMHMGKSKGSLHDLFWCVDGAYDWHRQAESIKRLIKSTPSKILADLLTNEANELLRTRKCPKSGNWYDL